MKSWILLSLLVLSSPTWAAGKPAKGDNTQQAELKARFEQAFKTIDSNGDGKISKEEAAAKSPNLAANFDAVDTNKDGFLSLKEIWDAQQKMSEAVRQANEKFTRSLQKADKNNDGKLSREEAKALPRLSNNFDQIDANKDGFLMLPEIIGFMQAQLRAQVQAQAAAAQKASGTPTSK